MHSVVWILITIFCSSCVGVSVWLLSRKSHSVDFKALGLKQNKAFLEQLDHERAELKKSKEQKKVLKAKLAQSDRDLMKALLELSKETSNDEKELSDNPDLLDNKLDQLLTGNRTEDTTKS